MRDNRIRSIVLVAVAIGLVAQLAPNTLPVHADPSTTCSSPTGQQHAVLLLVEEALSSCLGSSYELFKDSLTYEGYQVLEETVSSNTAPPVIKDMIRANWSEPEYELDGAILIGNIKAAYAIIHTGDYSDPNHHKVWLSLDAVDMYYEDLTGSWDHLTALDLNNIVASAPPQVSELHLYPSYDTFRNEYLASLNKELEWDPRSIPDKDEYSIEIWVARIMAHNLSVPGQDEAQILADYFAWNHRFRTGEHAVRDTAYLLNTGPGFNDQGMDYSNIFSDVVMAENATKGTYLAHLQESSGSKLTYLSAHSWPKGHSFFDQFLLASEMNGLHKNSVFYLLNACSACRWDEFVSTPSDPNYMGGLYVFGKTHPQGDFGLGAIGITGVGGFNNLQFFTECYYVSPAAPYGEMFIYWFNRNLPINFSVHNYVLLGDPTIGPDSGRGCSPDLVVFDPQISGCTVTINGVVTSPCNDPVQLIHWEWGDTTSEDSWFPATHTYAQSGAYVVTVTAHTAAGYVSTKTKVATVSCAVEDHQIYLPLTLNSYS